MEGLDDSSLDGNTSYADGDWCRLWHADVNPSFRSPSVRLFILRDPNTVATEIVPQVKTLTLMPQTLKPAGEGWHRVAPVRL